MSPQLFREGDLEALAHHPRIQLRLLDSRLQTSVVDAHNQFGCGAMEYYHPTQKEYASYESERLRSRIKVLLKILASVYSLEAVLSHNVRHLADLEWAHVGESLKLPNIVLNW